VITLQVLVALIVEENLTGIVLIFLSIKLAEAIYCL